MGKLRDIPVLKAALAERTQQLRNAGAGVSDAAAARMGLVTPDEFSKSESRTEGLFPRDLVERAVRSATSRFVGDPDPVEINRHLLAENERLTLQVAEWAKVYEQEMAAARATFEELRAENKDLREKNPREAEMILMRGEVDRLKAFIERTDENIKAMFVENERLTRQLAQTQADLRRRTTRFNPATMCEEPWDPVAVLDDIRAQIPRDRRLEGYTTAGAVEHMARLLAAAEARATPEDLAVELLRAVKLEPGMLIALRGGEATTHATLRRVAEGIDKTLRARFGSMTYGSPVVVMLPPDSSMETVPTGGRGAVQVSIHEGRKARPTDVPKDVARIYAVAAADSFGVTPEVVRRKRSERRAAEAVRLGLGPAPVESGQYLRCGSLLARVESVYVRRDYRCWYIDLALCDADGMPLPTEGDAVSGISGPASELLTQFVTKVSAPIPRGERRPIGTLIGWEDPDDLLLADAPAGEA